jgi:Recombinase
MMGPMEQVRGKTSSRWRGTRGAVAGKRAAEARARALASTLRELRAAGFISRRALADELNRRGIPTARGGSWQYTTVVRMLTRLGLLTSGKGGRINNGQASRQGADARAKALASTIRELQAKGFISFSAIARELNARKIPTSLNGRWHPASVSRLLQRLERLDRPSSRRH